MNGAGNEGLGEGMNRATLHCETASLLCKLLRVKGSICSAACGPISTRWKTALYSPAADNVFPCAPLCFNYAWHSSHTVTQRQQNEEMPLHWKSNESEDTCSYTVIDYYLKTKSFLGLMCWWLPTYHPLPYLVLTQL